MSIFINNRNCLSHRSVQWEYFRKNFSGCSSTRDGDAIGGVVLAGEVGAATALNPEIFQFSIFNGTALDDTHSYNLSLSGL